MPSLKELIAQKEALEKQIQDTQAQEREQAIAQVRNLMSEYGLTLADLQLGKGGAAAAKRGAASSAKSKVAVKYRDSATGDSWSGRGLQPRWLKAALASGRSIDEFRV